MLRNWVDDQKIIGWMENVWEGKLTKGTIRGYSKDTKKNVMFKLQNLYEA